jgi:hypothetical protein
MWDNFSQSIDFEGDRGCRYIKGKSSAFIAEDGKQ